MYMKGKRVLNLERGQKAMRYLYRTVNVTDNEATETSFALDYYVLAKEVEVEEQKVIRYGIEIYKRGRRPAGTAYAEYRKIFDVFATEGEAMEVLDIMANNTVTPISMKDVLEDLLGVEDFAGEALFVEAV